MGTMQVLSSVDDTVCETCPQGSIPNQVIFLSIITFTFNVTCNPLSLIFTVISIYAVKVQS